MKWDISNGKATRTTKAKADPLWQGGVRPFTLLYIPLGIQNELAKKGRGLKCFRHSPLKACYS